MNLGYEEATFSQLNTHPLFYKSFVLKGSLVKFMKGK